MLEIQNFWCRNFYQNFNMLDFHWNFQYIRFMKLWYIVISIKFMKFLYTGISQNFNMLESLKFEYTTIVKISMSDFPVEILICQDSIGIPDMLEFTSEILMCQNFQCQKFQYLRISGVRNTNTSVFPKFQYVIRSFVDTLGIPIHKEFWCIGNYNMMAIWIYQKFWYVGITVHFNASDFWYSIIPMSEISIHWKFLFVRNSNSSKCLYMRNSNIIEIQYIQISNQLES